MASGEKNVKVVWKEGTCDVKLENLSGKGEPRKVNGKEIVMKSDGSPKITYKNPSGDELAFCRVDQNGTVIAGSLSNGYANSKGELAQDKVPYYETIDGEHIEAVKNEKSEVFEVSKFEPMKAYLDRYIIDKFYQVKPSQGKSKKDYQRNVTIRANTVALKKLYDHMVKNNVVGRGTLNITSSGFLPTIAYIRPVSAPNGSQDEWTLEIGVFKQQKRFTWKCGQEVEEITPESIIEQQPANVPSIDEI